MKLVTINLLYGIFLHKKKLKTDTLDHVNRNFYEKEVLPNAKLLTFFI